jgi:hypothetical protein
LGAHLLVGYFKVRRSHRIHGPPRSLGLYLQLLGSSCTSGEHEKYEQNGGFTLCWAWCLVSNMLSNQRGWSDSASTWERTTPHTSPHWLVSGYELCIQAGIHMMWTAILDIQLAYEDGDCSYNASLFVI